MSKIKPQKIEKQTNFIDTSRNERLLQNKNSAINFSFKYFKEEDDFSITNHDPLYYKTVVERLRDMSDLSFLELVQNKSKALRFHRINWDDSGVTRDGFGLSGDSDMYDEAYQFNVSANMHGRIMGFVTENRIFNIVWFDKNHDLYE